MAFNREELLKRLHSLPFSMYLTALPSEYCLEVNLISAKGTSYSWEALDGFEIPAYRLKGLSQNEVAMIKDHIVSKALYLNDLNGTQLKKIISVKDDTTELSSIFVDFLQLPDNEIESLYCYRNPETGCIYFSDKPEKISDILNDQYPVDTPWEKLSDEQLEDAVELYEGNEFEIPFSCFD